MIKKFILRTFLFIIPLLLIVVFCEFAIRNIPNDYNSKKNQILKNGSEFEILVLGSSHVYYGINPEFFDQKCFNLAHIAQTPEFDLKLLKKYLPHMKNVKTVIYPISYFTFFWDLQSSTEAWRLKNYTIYYHLKAAQSFKDHAEVLSIDFPNNYKRVKDYYIHNRSELGVTPLGWGFNCLAEHAGNLEETGKSAAERHSNFGNQFFNKNSIEVADILRICNENGIKVILLFPPGFQSYRSHINTDQLQLTYNKIDTLLSQYPNCHFINLFADTSFTASHFLDGDHLNDQGAKKMSQFLNQYLIQYEK